MRNETGDTMKITKNANIYLDKSGHIIMWSPEAEKMFGWLKKDIINKKYSDKIILPKLRKKFNEELISIYQNVKKKYFNENLEINSLHRTGNELIVELTIIPVVGDDFYFNIIARDDTQRKRIEEELKASEMRYRTFIDQASDAVMITDLTGKFIDVNKRLCEMFGYKREELINANVSKVIDPDQLKNEPIEFEKIKKGKSVLRERRMMHKDGTIIEVEANVKMFPDKNIVAIARDITERKKMETILRENEFMFRKLTENEIFGFAWADIEGRMLKTNDALCKMLGYSPKELKGMHWSNFTHPDDVAREYKLAEKIIRGETDHYQLEKRLKSKGGNIIWVELNISGYRNKNKSIEFFVAIVQNINDRKIAEEELKRSHGQLRELSSHLQTVREEERANIAREIHDVLGHQLTTMKMETTMLKKRISSENSLAIEKINRINVIIDDTVKTVREISSQLRPGMLDDLGLVDALDWQSNEFEKNTGIQSSFSSQFDDTVIEKNLATAIFRVYQECLTNIARHSKASQVKTTIESSGNGIILKIHDNGKGFDETEVRNKKTLGLVGMKERAGMFGGNFSIKNIKNNGTLVTLDIPISGYKEKSESSSFRILIADDHNIVRRGLKEFLLEEFPDSYIKEVNDGNKLLKAVREGQWSIVISDVSMPGLNGIDTMKQLKIEFPKLPVLILSMHPEDQYAIRAMKAGASGYLTKEAAPEELVTAVKTILGGKRYITPTIANKLAEIVEGGITHELHESLSDREFDVLKLIASGKTISQISKKLSISITTVSTYRARILNKMKFKTNAELTHYAIENKLA